MRPLYLPSPHTPLPWDGGLVYQKWTTCKYNHTNKSCLLLRSNCKTLWTSLTSNMSSCVAQPALGHCSRTTSTILGYMARLSSGYMLPGRAYARMGRSLSLLPPAFRFKNAYARGLAASLAAHQLRHHSHGRRFCALRPRRIRRFRQASPAESSSYCRTGVFR